MLLSAVFVLVVAQLSSEIPEGLMNNPVVSLTQGRMEFLNIIQMNVLFADSAVPQEMHCV